MSTVQQSGTTLRKGETTLFECHSSAKAVFLAGSFNNWSPVATPMTRENGGHWTVSLPLTPGHHEYKFVVDGQWYCEPGCTLKDATCPRCTLNEFGTMNRVLEVQ